MKVTLPTLSLVSLGTSITITNAQESEYIPFDTPVKPVILTPEPYTYLTEVDLPPSLDWRNYNNTNYCGKVLNQKNPNVCGSCWAHSATSALSDRYNIATENKFTSTLAPQNLINFKLRYTCFMKYMEFYMLPFLIVLLVSCVGNLEPQVDPAKVVIISKLMILSINMVFLMIIACHMLE